MTDDRSREILTAEMWIRDHDQYGLEDNARMLARQLLDEGLFEEYKSWNPDKIHSFHEIWDENQEVLEAVEIANLYPVYGGQHFRITKIDYPSFKIQYRKAFGRFPFKIGSEDYLKVMYEYCVKFGFYNPHTYLPFVAHVLKDSVGEEKVIKLLNRIVKETAISAYDFILLANADDVLDDTPISWAVNILK